MSIELTNIFTEPGVIPAGGFQIGSTTFVLDPVATAGLVNPIAGTISIDGNTGRIVYNETAAEIAAGPIVVRAAMIAQTVGGCLCSDPFVVDINVPVAPDPCAGLTVVPYVGPGACPALPSYVPATHDFELSGLETGFTAPTFTQIACVLPVFGTTIALGTVAPVTTTKFRYSPTELESGTSISLCFGVEETSGGQTGCTVILTVVLTLIDFCTVLTVNNVVIG